LTVNETKTRLCRVPEETFDFLGYTFGRCYSPKTGRPYLGTKPSAKKVQRLCRSISEMTDRGTTWQPTEAMVTQLNRKLSSSKIGRSTVYNASSYSTFLSV
jgi:RNA-directed DNA polymerase